MGQWSLTCMMMNQKNKKPTLLKAKGTTLATRSHNLHVLNEYTLKIQNYNLKIQNHIKGGTRSIFMVPSISSFNIVISLTTQRSLQLEWPRKVASLPKVQSHSHDLVNKILHTVMLCLPSV
ncbi:hypothetical protein STAS_31229 [Striga asiatica]|uniref:Uncharacterized protein n=1 Tax=Striga asiatica TaxID=4170 RepID=A0A5A7R8Q7_STRAF|nr:hypothetical protein STAS_31229 [Striga asiatica]